MFGFFSKKKKQSAKAAKNKKPVAAKSATATKRGSNAARSDELPATSHTAAPIEKAPPKPAAESAGANLDRAKAALDKRAAVPTSRKELIQQALDIQQAQSKLLDHLPDETRQRLRALALKTLVLGRPEDKKKLH